MKDFIVSLVKQLVDNPDDVAATEKDDEQGYLISLSVNNADMGKIIGKNGRTIRSLRDLLHIKALKTGTKASLQLLEPVTNSSQTPETNSA